MMGTRTNGSTFERTYEEFEPFCSWTREEGRDVLEVHLPEFKKDQLKVRINSLRVLMITGERPINSTKWSRFCKELPIPSNANANEIRAKFSGAKLIISMPKIPTASTQVEESRKANEDNNNNESIVNNNAERTNGNEAAAAAAAAGMVSELKNPSASGLGMSKKTAAVAVAAVVLAVAAGAYVTCKYYWS